jgi:hypothetical protein
MTIDNETNAGDKGLIQQAVVLQNNLHNPTPPSPAQRKTLLEQGLFLKRKGVVLDRSTEAALERLEEEDKKLKFGEGGEVNALTAMSSVEKQVEHVITNVIYNATTNMAQN